MKTKSPASKPLHTIVLWSVLLFAVVARGDEPRTLTVQLTVPDAAWTLAIDAVYEVKGQLWVVSTVSRDKDMMGAQVISTLKDSVTIQAPDLPVKYIIIGKTWNWTEEKGDHYRYVKSRKQLAAELSAAKQLYPVPDDTAVL